jgi:hypothetical protein
MSDSLGGQRGGGGSRNGFRDAALIRSGIGRPIIETERGFAENNKPDAGMIAGIVSTNEIIFERFVPDPYRGEGRRKRFSDAWGRRNRHIASVQQIFGHG